MFFFVSGTDLLHNIIDNDDEFTAVYRSGDLKLIMGEVGTYNGWYYTDGTNDAGDEADVYLFNIAGKHGQKFDHSKII